MVDEKRSQNRKNPKRSVLETYFFLEGDLHRKLHINRGKDLITLWNYPAGKKVKHNYSTVIRRHKKAFTTTQVAKMVNRSRVVIENILLDGHIERPQMTYALDEMRRPHKYMWKEEEIMGLLEYLSGIHQGRPRKDGQITNNNLPTPRELRAMINDEAILYVRQGDTFVPTWRAKEF